MSKTDTTRFLTSHVIAGAILFGGFYALVLYPFQLDDLVKGAIISLMTLAAQHVFGDQQASANSRRQQAAFETGLYATPAEGSEKQDG